MSPLTRAITDGVVTIRPATPADVPALVAGRDEVSRRFLGEGDPEPRPMACIVLGPEGDGPVIGWVDHDHDRPWLADDEVNLGYQVFPDHRGRGVRNPGRPPAGPPPRRGHRLEGRDAVDRRHQRALPRPRRASRLRRVDDLDGHPYWKLAVAPPE